MEIFLIDGIGPFFRNYKKKQVNWSKIPFQSLCQDPQACEAQFTQIAKDLDHFAQQVSRVGYNSITLDDVAHLAQDPWIEPELQDLIALYACQYRKLFSVCSHHGLDVYLTMDVLSSTQAVKKKIHNRYDLAKEFLLRQVKTILTQFPEVRGLILRIGECDGKDVKGDFTSKLVIRTPGQANQLLCDLLPLFEAHQRYLILRNWTVGAYPIGDFIWHRGTIAKVLKGIESPCFILSLKYGESDFFRYLPLNKSFFHLKVKKIIELQARREYEGCGEYPSFIGWDYQNYARQLLQAENMAGISVWCQTGGWLPFRRLSYLDPSGFWNELNSYVSLKLFQSNQSVEEAVSGFAQEAGIADIPSFIRFLKLNDEVIKELLYIEEIAGQKLFFRRIRIPPLLTVYWNNIFINHSVRKVLRTLVESGEQSVEQGYRALEKIKEMEAIAQRLDLPVEDIRFMYDTFSLLALAREYYFLPFDPSIKKRIRKAKKKYKKKYPKGSRPRYKIKTNFSPFAVKRVHFRWLKRVLLRKKRGYRVLDYFLTLHILAIAFRLLMKVHPKLVPRFARKHAMGIETLFK